MDTGKVLNDFGFIKVHRFSLWNYDGYVNGNLMAFSNTTDAGRGYMILLAYSDRYIISSFKNHEMPKPEDEDRICDPKTCEEAKAFLLKYADKDTLFLLKSHLNL